MCQRFRRYGMGTTTHTHTTPRAREQCLEPGRNGKNKNGIWIGRTSQSTGRSHLRNSAVSYWTPFRKLGLQQWTARMKGPGSQAVEGSALNHRKGRGEGGPQTRPKGWA